MAPERFMEEIAQYTARIIRQAEAEPVDEQRWGSCPRCGCPVIQGKRGYGCSAWKDGCKFVLWPTYKDRELDPADIRELLQRRVLLRPIELAGAGRVILALTGTGEVTDIAVPTREQQAGKIKRKRSGSARSRKRSTGAERGFSRRRVRHPWELSLVCCRSPGTAKILQLQRMEAGMQVRHLENDRRQEDQWPHGQNAAHKGQTRRLKGFKSKAGKPFEARLKLVDGEVQLDFSS